MIDMADIVRLREIGKTHAEIGAILGCSCQNVQARLSAAGIAIRRRQPLSPAVISAIADFRGGASFRTAAGAHGVSLGSLRRGLEREGVDTARKTPHPAPKTNATNTRLHEFLVRRRLTIARAAEEIGVSTRTVARALQAHESAAGRLSRRRPGRPGCRS